MDGLAVNGTKVLHVTRGDLDPPTLLELTRDRCHQADAPGAPLVDVRLDEVAHRFLGGWLATLVAEGHAEAVGVEDPQLTWTSRDEQEGMFLSTGAVVLAPGLVTPGALVAALRFDTGRPRAPHLVAYWDGTLDPSGHELLWGLVRTAEEQAGHFRGRVLAVSQAFRSGLASEYLDPCPIDLPSEGAPILDETVLEQVREEFVHFVPRSQRLLAAGLGARRGILLHGPPGTGKTHLIRYLANETAGELTWLLPPASVVADQLWRLFDLAEKLSPSVVVLEDLDVVASRSTASRSSSFLNALDGVASRGAVLTVATTNDLRALGEAALRPGRFDRLVELAVPSRDMRARMWHELTIRVGVEVDAARLAARSDGRTGADIREAVRRAVMANDEISTETLLAHLDPSRFADEAFGTYM